MTSFRKGTLIVGLVTLAAMSFAQQPDQEKVRDFAHAIAKAEGFGIKGVIPTRCHNPGDIRIKPGHTIPGMVGRNKQGYVIFKNDRAGWLALENQINMILQGRSRKYNADMPLFKIGEKYTPGSGMSWAKNVSKQLNVTPTTTLRGFVNAPVIAPELVFSGDSRVLAEILSIQPVLPELPIPTNLLDELFGDDVPMHLDPKVQRELEQELQHRIFETDQENPQRQSVLI